VEYARRISGIVRGVAFGPNMRLLSAWALLICLAEKDDCYDLMKDSMMNDGRAGQAQSLLDRPS
jgi:hypothetical protein